MHGKTSPVLLSRSRCKARQLTTPPLCWQPWLTASVQRHYRMDYSELHRIQRVHDFLSTTIWKLICTGGGFFAQQTIHKSATGAFSRMCRFTQKRKPCYDTKSGSLLVQKVVKIFSPWRKSGIDNLIHTAGPQKMFKGEKRWLCLDSLCIYFYDLLTVGGFQRKSCGRWYTVDKVGGHFKNIVSIHGTDLETLRMTLLMNMFRMCTSGVDVWFWGQCDKHNETDCNFWKGSCRLWNRNIVWINKYNRSNEI